MPITLFANVSLGLRVFCARESFMAIECLNLSDSEGCSSRGGEPDMSGRDFSTFRAILMPSNPSNEVLPIEALSTS